MSTVPGISGLVLVRNVISLDYHWRETIKSILPVCDEVLVCDSDSADGTTEAVQEWMKSEPKLRYLNWAFSNPVGDYYWHDRWMNYARPHLKFDTMLYMDADHVIGPESHHEIKSAALHGQCRMFHYHFFWSSPQVVIPWGSGLSTQLAPSRYWLPGQNEVPKGEENIRDLAMEHGTHPNLNIYSYSMLRKREAFFAKCAAYGTYITGIPTDEAIEQAKATGRPVTEFYPGKQITAFTGTHPEVMREWLEERGWKI